MTEIVPAILPTSVEDLSEKLSKIPAGISLVHIDILENDIWAELSLPFEAHIMAKEPEELALTWARRGAFSVIVHKVTEELANEIREHSKLGLGVQLYVPLEDIQEDVSRADFLHLMSIAEIGAQGRPFEPEIFDRIKEVKERFPDMSISVDGGVSTENFKELEKLGVDRVAVGSKFEELWSSQMRK